MSILKIRNEDGTWTPILSIKGEKGDAGTISDETIALIIQSVLDQVPTAEIRANTSARHSHNNIIVLDAITSDKVTEWDGKSTFSGNYDDLNGKPTLFDGNYNSLENKPTIPTVPTEEISANTSARHTHDNKAVLDGVTAAKVFEWNNKAERSEIPDAVTDDHINALIDTKLGGFNGGGIIVDSTAPEGDSSMLWIDMGNGGIAKYWNGSAWIAVKSIWG